MGEFGHIGVIGPGFCMDTWGVGPLEIEVCDKRYSFEDSDRFGPSIILKDGSIAVRQPGEKSPFWTAHFAWVKQGRKTADDGVTCVWTPLRPTTYYLVGREMFIVDKGDECGELQEVPKPEMSVCNTGKEK